MDKTGTLTQGAPSVVDVVPMNGHDETELLVRAGALELNSNHPLARAIVEEARRRDIELTPAEDFETLHDSSVILVSYDEEADSIADPSNRASSKAPESNGAQYGPKPRNVDFRVTHTRFSSRDLAE